MKTKLLIIFCLVLSNYLPAQNSWTLSNTGFEEGFCITDFVVTKSNNLFALGARVTTTPNYKSTPAIYQSLNNGNSWIKIDTITYYPFQTIQKTCAIGDTLLLSNSFGVYKSGNNGNSWALVNYSDYDFFSDFAVTKTRKIFAIKRVNMCCPTFIYPAIFESTDIGSTWSLLNPIGLVNYNDNYYYNAICAIGDTLLLSVSKKDGTCYVCKSTNGGTNWIRKSGSLPDFKITGFAMTETNVVYAIGTKNSSSAIYKSADIGNTWEKVDTIGLADYNFTFKGIGAVENTILLSAENKKGDDAVFRLQDRTSMNDFRRADDFKVYPNPSIDFIAIECNSQNREKIQGVEILSLNGAIVKCFDSNFDRLNITDLTPGIYILKIKTEQQSHQTRIDKM